MKTFAFDIDKTLAAVAYLARKKADGRISIFLLLKMLYAAERHALSEWHRPITGDGFSSLPKGPILSRTYNLIKGEVLQTNSDAVKWSKFISPRSGNFVQLVAEPDYDYLSQRELEALDYAFDEISALEEKYGTITEVLHQKWPEWKDPEKNCGKLSMPLEVKDILSELLGDDDEVERVSLEIESVQSAKAALQTS